jgi:hypothetical protein
MILKIGIQVQDVKRGPRNFFGVRIFSGGFRIGSRKPCGPWVLSDWKEIRS